MENLDKLTATGLPVFDLNSENLDRKDWSETVLGSRDQWPLALRTLVNTCILPIPYPVAVFWGSDLAIVHNLAWGKASGNLDGQGARASDSYSGQALSSLRASTRGRTVKVACRFFYENTDAIGDDATILLSTILDENGERQGTLAQLLHHTSVEKHLPLSGLDSVVQQNEARQTKASGDQQSPSAKKVGVQLPIKNEKNSTDKDDQIEQVDSKQTQLFQRFAELLPNGLAILDSHAEAVFVNDGFFKLTTRKGPKEFRAWPDSIHPADYERVMDAYRKAFSSREELQVEFRCALEAADSDDQWRLFLLKPLSQDPEAGFICTVIDITEIKEAQLTQEKAAQEATERKQQQERFIDMVSHEIRNPLSAVLHLAEEIKEVARELKASSSKDKDSISDILEAADTILLCVSHQNTLVDDILSFSKLDSMMLSLVPRVVRPKWEFSSALKVFNSEFKAKHIDFHYAMDVSYEEASIETVIADLNRMKQVLVNLITNAIKFTSKKKGDRRISVTVGCSYERPTSYPPNVVFFSEDKDAFHIDSTMSAEWGTGPSMYIMVAVKDTGIGISTEDQIKLFERFRQATPKTQENYGGSGLGLFISRKLCQLHGGDIGVSSKEGEGSTFGFFFRARRPTGESEAERPKPNSRNPSDKSVTDGKQDVPTPDGVSKDISTPENAEGSFKDDLAQRPKPDRLTSRGGVDVDDVDNSLKDPPTEYCDEAHPKASEDEKYAVTKDVSDQVQTIRPSKTKLLDSSSPDLEQGETPRQAKEADNLSKSQSEDSKQHPTLLLVEDNLINQKVLRRQLQSRGFEVWVANNGQEAVDAVEERGRLAKEGKSPTDFFDCILMDQEMPIKDGNQATKDIRELQNQGKAGYSPILGVSANVREAQTDAMKEAGMDAIISKPFKVDDLTKKIQSLLPMVRGKKNKETEKDKGKDKSGS